MTPEERNAAAESLLNSRARINAALNVEQGFEGVESALLSYVASEARRLADLLEVMRAGDAALKP